MMRFNPRIEIHKMRTSRTKPENLNSLRLGRFAYLDADSLESVLRR